MISKLFPQAFSVVDDEDYSYELLLTPYKEFYVKLRNKLLYNSGETWNVSDSENYLGADEDVFVVLTRVILPGEDEQIEVLLVNLSNEASQTVPLSAAPSATDEN